MIHSLRIHLCVALAGVVLAACGGGGDANPNTCGINCLLTYNVTPSTTAPTINISLSSTAVTDADSPLVTVNRPGFHGGPLG